MTQANRGSIPGGGKLNVCLQGALLEDRNDLGQVSLKNKGLKLVHSRLCWYRGITVGLGYLKVSMDYGLSTEIDTIEYQQTEKIETEVRDDDRIQKHTGVRNIIQGVLLGHSIHTISYYHILLFPPCQQDPLMEGNSQMDIVLYRITRQLLHRVSILYIKSILDFSTRVVQ